MIVRSLRAKFALLLLPVVLTVTAAVSGLLWLQREQAMTQSLHDGVRAVMQGHAPALAELVWTLDETNVARLLGAMRNAPDIECVVVIDSWTNTRRGLPDAGCLDDFGAGNSLSLPLAVDEQVIGDLTVGFTEARVQAELMDRFRADSLILIALVLATLATVYLAFGRTVTRPLGRLMSSIRSHRDTGARGTVDWTSSDELGRVIDAYNAMIAEVDQRTADLERANQALQDEKQASERAYARLDAAHADLAHTEGLLRDSIRYARRIQESLLPDKRALDGLVADIRICWEPLDVVGGDYFWLERIGGKALICVADCTGHGVPGAFMTLVTASALDRILHERAEYRPAAVLEHLDHMVRARLRQDRPETESDDGLEAAVVLWDPETRRLTYAGAGVPLMVARADGTVETVKANRVFLGYQSLVPATDIAEQMVDLGPGDRVYLASDGVPDHMRGQRPKHLFGRKRVARAIASTLHLPLGAQIDALRDALADWSGPEPRRDDMTLVGIMPLAPAVNESATIPADRKTENA